MIMAVHSIIMKIKQEEQYVMSKRQVFFSFEFGKDAWRAGQVRNMGKVSNSSTFSDNDWEEVKEKNDEDIKNGSTSKWQ